MANNSHHRNPLIANRMAFLVIGCIEAAWGPLVPYVKEAFAIDEGALGLLLLCSGLGSIIALPIAGYICMKHGAKRTVMVAGVLMATALLAIGMMIDVWLTAAMLMVFGACTIIIDVSANVNGIAVEGKTGRHLMSGFHGGYSLGTLLGAAAMSLLFTAGLAPLWAVGLCMVAVMAAMFWGCQDLLPKEELRSKKHVEKPTKRRFYIPPVVIVAGLICFVMYATEGAVMSWSAVFVSQERGVDLAYAGFFYTAFAVMMTVLRFLGDKVVERLGRRFVVSFGALLVALGYALVILIPTVFGAILGFALVGLGAANVVPQVVSFAGSLKGMSVQNIISTINALGYSGILVGPVLIGFVAKHFGLPTAFIGFAACCFAVAAMANLIAGAGGFVGTCLRYIVGVMACDAHRIRKADRREAISVLRD